MVYEPREDSLLLESAVRRFARGKVLDMGTGSGIQALAAKSKGLDVLAADIDPEAVEAAQAHGIKAVQSDLFHHIADRFDTIIFNPPYLPDEGPPLSAVDGGPTGLEVLERFLSAAKDYLTPGGQILFVHSSATGIERVKQLLLELGYEWEALLSKRIFFEQLVVFRAWYR